MTKIAFLLYGTHSLIVQRYGRSMKSISGKTIFFFAHETNKLHLIANEINIIRFFSHFVNGESKTVISMNKTQN